MKITRNSTENYGRADAGGERDVAVDGSELGVPGVIRPMQLTVR